MINTKCWIVTGTGGSRIDFVAGWLGTLPGFVNNNWGVDPTTGQSTGEMRMFKQLDYAPDYAVRTCLRDFGDFELTHDADLTYVGACHGRYLNLQIQNDPIKILYINIAGADLNKIAWEFLVKTYLSTPTIRQQSFSIDAIEEKIKNFKLSSGYKPHATSTVLDYSKLFQPGGSRYLCNCLQLVVDNRYHEFYSNQLTWADTPREISALGRTWRYSDYF